MSSENDNEVERKGQAAEEAAKSAEPDSQGPKDSGAAASDEAAENPAGEAPAAEKTAAERIAELEAEAASWKDQFLRKSADFDNYRKRMIAEKADAVAYANASLLKDLLESLDNFDRTVDAAETATDAKSIADGVRMISKSLVSMLENKYSLVGYGAVGDPFDPDVHEAIGMQEGDVGEEQLAAVYLKGYKLKDRVLRHAKVMVVKPKA